MSKTFMSAASDREVRIWPANLGFAVAVIDPVTNETTSTQLANTVAPALALAILEAAGCVDRGDTLLGDALRGLKGHLHNIEQEAKEAADREVLEKRRNELAIEFGSSPLGYNDTFESTQRAIDRVIELEDKAKS